MVDHDPSTQIRAASGINTLLGTLLIALPWLLDYPSWVGLTRNSIIVGGMIVICASLRVVRPRSSVVCSVANIVLGFWTLMSPLIFGYAATSGWLIMGVGAAVIASAAWSGNAIVRPEGGPVPHRSMRRPT
jgi:SPW repeat